MIAVWSVTRSGGEGAVQIAKILGGTPFTLKKFNIPNTESYTSLDILSEKFHEYSAHIFIMSTGIVVRSIAKYLRGKDIDPAVLVIDENITFVISLLSGHLGGANALTEMVAGKLNITPIITTSSDITGKIAVDTLAEKLNGRLESLSSAKTLTSLIVDGKVVELHLPPNILVNKSSRETSGIVIATNKEKVEISKIYLKNIIVGIGCRRGAPIDTIGEAVKLALSSINISEKSIKHLATVDVKSDEIGLIEYAREKNLPLLIVSRDDIRKLTPLWEESEYVRSSIGVGAVSAPCAYSTSNKGGKFLLEKMIHSGVTVSVYEE